MPNPNDPEQAECQRCYDSGFIPGTYRLCNCTVAQADLIREAVIALWNEYDGWIPGAGYQRLADVLGVGTDRLSHYDAENKRRVGPPDHRHHAGLSVLDGHAVYGQCIVWVDNVRCAHDVREG